MDTYWTPPLATGKRTRPGAIFRCVIQRTWARGRPGSRCRDPWRPEGRASGKPHGRTARTAIAGGIRRGRRVPSGQRRTNPRTIRARRRPERARRKGTHQMNGLADLSRTGGRGDVRHVDGHRSLARHERRFRLPVAPMQEVKVVRLVEMKRRNTGKEIVCPLELAEELFRRHVASG